MISQTLRDARRYEDAMAQNITPLERPEFHLSPKVGWMNDPNGFSYYNMQALPSYRMVSCLTST